MAETARAEVIAVGASAGGVEALTELVRHLPPELPSPVIVVLHVSPSGTSVLPQILSRRGPLPARMAGDGDPLMPGEILVAPGDFHLRAVDGHVRLDREPRENGHRPAIDPLFRSVAQAFGARAVGVVLSGTRDDGTAGLNAIKQAGGWALAQDPGTALYPGMPANAIAGVAVDAVLDVPSISRALASLVAQGAISHDGLPAMSDRIPAPPGVVVGPPAGGPMHFACPDCGGVMTEFVDDELTRFGCHVGHQYSLESLLETQYDKVEEALWTAVRALEERAATLRRTATLVSSTGYSLSADSLHRQARDCEEKATRVREAVMTIRPIAEEGGAP